MLNIAVITPQNKEDYLTNTVLDGLISRREMGEEISFYISSDYPCRFPVKEYFLARPDFIKFAQTADLIFFCWGKNNTDHRLAEEVNAWDKLIYIDGSEVGGNRRYNTAIQRDIIRGQYDGQGKIEGSILRRAVGYARREKPYFEGITPFPFGIDRGYLAAYDKSIRKDIDFFCVFGQDEYPLMRRHVTELLEDFCRREGFSCHTGRVEQKEFYQILARSKVGISVGGGGYDTARFWELLGNNCLVVTETIDVYEPDSNALDYGRIWQFGNLYDYLRQLNKVGRYLRESYSQDNMLDEYKEILARHSSAARVGQLLDIGRSRGIID